MTGPGGVAGPVTEGATTGKEVVGVFKDTNPTGAIGNFVGTINWGDGQTSTFPSATAMVTQPGGVGTFFDVVGSHVYQQASATPYPVTVTVNTWAALGPW